MVQGLGDVGHPSVSICENTFPETLPQTGFLKLLIEEDVDKHHLRKQGMRLRGSGGNQIEHLEQDRIPKGAMKAAFCSRLRLGPGISFSFKSSQGVWRVWSLWV